MALRLAAAVAADSPRHAMDAALLCLLLASVTAAHGVLRGNSIRCVNEGSEVTVPNISHDPCITCRCLKSEVVCDKETCPTAKSCYLQEYSPKKTCCGACRGCLYEGRSYPTGAEWGNPADPCQLYSCQSGVVTVSRRRCYTPCTTPIPPGPGECCPSCPGCEHEGKIYSEGETIPTREGPCMKCQCQRGKIVCSKKACPVLPCTPSKFAQRPGECCPTCRGNRKVAQAPRCIIGVQAYKEGAAFTYDQCTHCTCNGTTSVCNRQVCPPLPCPPSHRIADPTMCCPECRGPEEHRAACIYKGTHYQSGSTWKMDKCTTCRCKDGQVMCSVDVCPKIGTCPPRHTVRMLAKNCCPSCVEDDGVCTVFGDPHYRTFDGRLYNFRGSCKYVLAQECQGRTFSVLVTNDPRASRTKAVTLKVDGTRLTLGRRGVVRVGKRRVTLPYLKLETLSVYQEDSNIIVRTNIGVKLFWDSESYLEVTVPPSYKNQTCGLCGDFNGNPEDDLVTRKGTRVTDVDVFCNSWKMNRKKPCTQPAPRKDCHQNWENHLRAIRECNVLKGAMFRPCHTTVSALPYFNACLQDVCECRQGRRCHCEALTAYTRECARAGATISADWRNQTTCLVQLALHALPHPAHPASARETCIACGSSDLTLAHRYWSCSSIRPLIREAFNIIQQPPDLQGWLFGQGLDDDALAILASAKSSIHRFFLSLEMRGERENPLTVWRRTLCRWGNLLDCT